MTSVLTEDVLKTNSDETTIINVVLTVGYTMEEKTNYIARNPNFKVTKHRS